MTENRTNDRAAPEFDPYVMLSDAIQDPPVSLWAALKKIGPGIILAGTIVGSGELVLTTSLGAKYGYIFLWLILFSCVIKVFIQVELGRYAISSGKPTLSAINDLPGPKLGAHLLVWWWLFMLIGTVFQLGAMTGGTAQALHLAFPQFSGGVIESLNSFAPDLAAKVTAKPEYPWAFLTCLTAMLLLWSGGYRRVEFLTTLLVVGVTMITLVATLSLQATDYPIRWGEVADGLMPQVPTVGVAVAVAAAFSCFGITGVGASELFYYPYWCLEKGYARFAGPRDDSPEWEARARGWIRVLQLDAWVSMIVFTISTVAFYFMGATVLHRQGIDPKGGQMIAALSEMYVGPFGAWTKVFFLVGAGTVLFKTLYISCAANGRLATDFLSLAKFVRIDGSQQRSRWIQGLCLFFPVFALSLYLAFGEPRWMVTVGGFGQAATLPMISAAAVYFRYRKTDRRIAPSGVSDALLWIAFVSITVVATYAVGSQIWSLVQEATKPA